MKHNIVFALIIITIMINGCTNYYNLYKETELASIREMSEVILSNPQAIRDILTDLRKSDLLTSNSIHIETIEESMQEVALKKYKYKYYDEKMFYKSSPKYPIPNKYNKDIKYLLSDITYIIVYQRVDDEKEFCSFRYKYTDKTGWYLSIVLLQDELNPPYYRL